jgi:hypothetical protein
MVVIFDKLLWYNIFCPSIHKLPWNLWIDGQKILYHNNLSNITTMELVDRWTEDIIP